MPELESAMRHVFEIECKDKGFLNESVSEFHQSCIKPLIFLRFCYLRIAMICRIRSTLMQNSSAKR